MGQPLAIIVLVLTYLAHLLLGSPILFRHVRPYNQGVPFEIVKPRSLTSSGSEYDEMLPFNHRFILFGRWLRATSLDDLPVL
jgi:lipopolysaccharide/colanic/teichoic acid biosynthesis glycosyltransferase